MNKPRAIGSESSSRAYQIWPGNNKFFCKGKLIMGPDYQKAFISFFLIFAPEVLFLSTTGRFFVSNPVVLIASCVLSVTSLFFHFQVATKDPGYLPKQIPPFAKGPFNAPILTKALLEESTKACAIDRPYIEIPVNGTLVKLKYCLTCLLVRPPRTSHCSDCGLCVEKFDHHCPWVGNCIGKKNYKVYLAFLYSTSGLILFNLAFASLELVAVVSHLRKGERNGDRVFLQLLESSGGTLFFVVYTFVVFCKQIMWFVFFLSVFHSYLISTNQTTHEYLKKIWRTGPSNPYTYRNILKNVCRLVFKNSFPEHFDRQMPVSLNFDTYSMSPSKEGFVRGQVKAKNEIDRIQTNGLNSRNVEKVEESIDEDKNIILVYKGIKGIGDKVMNSPQDEKVYQREESFDEYNKIILNNKL